MRARFQVLLLAAALGTVSLHAGVIVYGTEDCLTTGCYGSADPTAGATMEGLAPGTVTVASSSFFHSFPFTPFTGDFPGTDQIYVGSNQTGYHDGYSEYSGRVAGPDVLTLDYSPLVDAGESVETLTLGIAADDFQYTYWGSIDPFTATVNGTIDQALTDELNSLVETGPVVQFFTIGLDPSIDTPSHTITISIDEGGDGGDGWAVDFATMGVTTTPEPSTLGLLVLGLGGLAAAARRLRR